MRKFLSFIALMLCCCLLCVGCGDSHTHENNGNIEPDVKPQLDLKVEECYTYTENGDGTYTYSVKGRSGMYIHEMRNSKRPASFAAANEDVLIIHGTNGTGRSQRWATFCDIEACVVSTTFGGFLAAMNDRVAYVEQRTGAYHVFVCDPFEPNEILEAHTLEGLSVADGADPITDFVLSAKGVLSVTYAVEGGHKTIEIDLLPAEDM